MGMVDCWRCRLRAEGLCAEEGGAGAAEGLEPQPHQLRLRGCAAGSAGGVEEEPGWE